MQPSISMPFGIPRLLLTVLPSYGRKDENFCQTCRMRDKQNGRLAEKSIFSYN